MRYAIRTLRRSPGFTIIALLTLALGIGANTAIFSFVNGVLLKPLPYRDPHGIVMVWEKPPGGDRNGISTLNFLDWKNRNTVFEHMAAIDFGVSVTLTGSGQPEQIQGVRVSASYFDIFGVQAALGRTFATDEIGRAHANLCVSASPSPSPAPASPSRSRACASPPLTSISSASKPPSAAPSPLTKISWANPKSWSSAIACGRTVSARTPPSSAARSH